MAEGAKAPGIFQLANQEFEGNEQDSKSPSPSGDMLLRPPEAGTSEEASTSPKVQATELQSSEDAAEPQNQSLGADQPARPSSEQVAMALGDMKRFMEEFGVDLATVTQAFLKTSGDVAAVACCLQTGPHPEDCPPLWTRQDDLDLLSGNDHLRSKLITKYGEENLNRRLAFRKN
uniref:telomeric repeat-binding factor 2-interacting protein 1 n=1 Tax=Euleptes europaea TaxID=460621 RepID=UPI002542160E|nr:telomeric repeat-binding factor 2-interacting protein 1 [Euleptes europaea]